VGAGETSSSAHVLLGSAVGGSAEQHNAVALRASLGQLIEGQAFATGLQDSGASGLGESQSANGELGHVEETTVIGDGTNDGGNSLRGLALGVLDETVQGQGGLPAARLHQSLVDDGIELGVSAAGQELVQAAQKLHVRVLGLADIAAFGALVLLGAFVLKGVSHG